MRTVEQMQEAEELREQENVEKQYGFGKDDPYCTFLQDPMEGAYNGDNACTDPWKERILSHRQCMELLIPELAPIQQRGYAPAGTATRGRMHRIHRITSVSRIKTEFVECTHVMYRTNIRPKQRTGTVLRRVSSIELFFELAAKTASPRGV
jgi:hypothetical protein